MLKITKLENGIKISNGVKSVIITKNDRWITVKPHGDEVKQIWENVLSETKPSSPCPIDEMHTIMENLGVKIVKYEEEFNSELVY